MPEIRVILPEKMENQIESLIREGHVGNKAEIVRTALAQYLLSMPSLSQKEYDTMLEFSPNGRIYQVEYAYEAVNKGPIAVGVCCDEGMTLIKAPNFTRSQPTWISPTHRFIDRLNERIAIASCGIGGDGQAIIRFARALLKDSEAPDAGDINSVADQVAAFVHACTLKTDARPLGASLIIGGLDLAGTPQLYSIDPSGTLWYCHVYAIGGQSQEAMHTLLIGITSVATLDDAIQLGLAAALQGKDNVEDYSVDVISKMSPQLRALSVDEILQYYEK
jgi:proteasome alpha subunit